MVIVVLVLLGLVLGSFTGALIWRTHSKQYSIWHGRSVCEHCGHELAAKDLVPLVSWLALRGKCRYCGKPISIQNLLVEIITAALFVVSYLAWQAPIAAAGMSNTLSHVLGVGMFGVWLLCLVLFVALTVYDIRWFLLPDSLVVPLIALAGLQTILALVRTHTWSSLYNPLLAVVIIFGLFWTLHYVSKGNWIGGGDVTLSIALGLLVATPAKAFVTLFAASLLGLAWSLPSLYSKRLKLSSHVPFGPFLLAAATIAVLWGQQLVDWYMRLVRVS